MRAVYDNHLASWLDHAYISGNGNGCMVVVTSNHYGPDPPPATTVTIIDLILKSISI